MCRVLAVVCAMVLFPLSCSATADTWTALPDVPSKRFGAVAFAYSGVVYVIGGKDTSSEQCNEGYSISLDQWATYQAMPTARYMSSDSGATYNEKVLMMAGKAGTTTRTTNCEVYDASLDAWVTRQSYPQALSTIAVAVVDDQAYGFGGESPSTTVSSVYAYSFNADTWTAKTSLPSIRERMGAAVVGTDIYCGGGNSGSSTLYRYSTTSDSYSVMQSIPTARESAGVATDGASLFFVGGDTPTTLTNHNQKYAIATDTWTTVTGAPVARKLSASVVVGQSFYYFGGWAATNAWRESHVYVMTVLLPMTAMVVGDPEFILFDGTRHHLYLHTGVFNVLSTTNLAVNVMVDVLPNLPPEDNRVIVMVGVTATIDSSTVMLVTCGVEQGERVVSCSGRYVFSPSSLATPPPTPHWRPLGNGARVEVGGFRVDVTSKRVNWIPGPTELSSLSMEGQRLDVAVTVPPTTTTHTLAGLLPDLQARGKEAVQARLSNRLYEVESGCLLSPTVPASEGVFHNAAAIQAGLAM